MDDKTTTILIQETVANLGSVGSVASIISLALTIWIFITLRNIKNRYLFTARVPTLIKRLGKHSSQISEYLNEFESFIPQIELELGKTQVDLDNLQKKLDGQSKKSVKQLLKNIKTYDPKNKNRAGLWDIYVELTKVEEEIKHYREDIKWEQ